VARRSLTVPSGPEAASAARGFVREVVDEKLPTDVTESVLLLTSELVTNATRHSGSPLGAGIDILVDLEQATVRVAVRDEGKGFAPDQPLVPSDEGGWGLHLVRTLASRWGLKKLGTKTEVWFEIQPGVPPRDR
jgi:anti-sigma regulatory factor (Ser/Thr protein kinase)